jgi:hypothetical protein
MTVFKILTSSSVGLDRSEFTAQFRSDKLAVGDSFVCFDMHHQTTFQVLLVSATTEHAQIVCAGRIGFNNQYAGGVVDTSASTQPDAFRYEHAAALA